MSEFELQEATVEGIGAAIRGGSISCRELVEAYLARIDAYDRQGPELNAVVTVNPEALAMADAVDAELSAGTDRGPMHGIPVLVKDQVETAGLTTTYGSEAFLDRVPDTDATAVTWLKKAGAIVLAKTVLPDFAVSWFGFSSSGGETKNPYVLTHDPGGSSSGTGAGVAANLGAVGIGEDTGGSIRVPASFCNLVGLRPTVGLVPRTGMSPLVTTQDTAGPMARNVADAAILLDVLAGYDPLDPYTSVHAWGVVPESGYFAALQDATLKGARIGVLRSAFGADDDPESGPVNHVMDSALEGLTAAGATVVDDLTVDALEELIVTTSLYTVQSKRDIDAFLSVRGLVPAQVADIVSQGRYHPACDLIEAIAEGPEDPTTDPLYFAGVAARFDFARAIIDLMAKHNLDALAFPDVQVTPPAKADVLAGKWNTLTYPTNTLIASQTSLPGISIPAGLTDEGLPVGIELIGPPLSEARLLRLAAAFEQETSFRAAPKTTPALNGH
jgi:Asp-tRNA(Asn)/Glu-tRNA(Gln) amidotransferase A subunit family amidase